MKQERIITSTFLGTTIGCSHWIYHSAFLGAIHKAAAAQKESGAGFENTKLSKLPALGEILGGKRPPGWENVQEQLCAAPCVLVRLNSVPV